MVAGRHNACRFLAAMMMTDPRDPKVMHGAEHIFGSLEGKIGSLDSR